LLGLRVTINGDIVSSKGTGTQDIRPDKPAFLISNIRPDNGFEIVKPEFIFLTFKNNSCDKMFFSQFSLRFYVVLAKNIFSIYLQARTCSFFGNVQDAA
jgi:hypothetical protein